MRKYIKYLRRKYYKVVQSIAFYPVLISTLYVVFAILVMNIEHWSIFQSLKENIPYLLITDYDTAKSMLSVFIGGIISLTVFSFSMVMVVLSQASSNFSPRLLPGLISSSKHQVILGTYVGSLLYCILILTSLGARGSDTNALGLSTMLAAIICVVCIGLFVYFIHNISEAIQIENMITKIFRTCETHTVKEIGRFKNDQIALSFVDTTGWNVLKTNETGYFRGFDSRLMPESLRLQSNQIEIIPFLNQFLWEGMPVLRVKEDIMAEDYKNLLFCINISCNRHERDNGLGGMIKLMEIAVKALSPGINDPGTAIDVISKLGILISQFLQLPHLTSQAVDSGECVLLQNNIPAQEIIRLIVQPIRQYAKADSAVLYKLIKTLQFVGHGENISEANRLVVSEELDSLRLDIAQHITNPTDKERLLKQFDVHLFEAQ